MRFAYSTLNWGATPDLEKMLAGIRQAGWGAVEVFAQPLDWLGPHTHFRTLLQQEGIRVAAFFGSVALPVGRQQLTEHKRRIDYAAELGADVYGLVGGSRLRWRPPANEEYADLADFCEELATYGVKRGVVVSYHPHVGCTVETEEETDRLMEATSELRLCLDVSHNALVGEDPIYNLQKYRDRLGYVHMKDWAKGRFVEMGQGDLGIDFPAILKHLETHRFDGWVVVEQSRSEISPLHSARLNAGYLKSLGYGI
jgi:inosose dehydratase